MKERYPLMLGLLALWLIMLSLVLADVRHNHGHLVYSLDDAYIHMAMAKNLAGHGVWGVTRHEFTSASSSILWSIILGACFRVFGAREIFPLLLNVLFASLAVVAGHRILAHYEVPRGWSAIVLVAMVFFAMFGPVSFSGLEHMLHTALTIPFFYLAIRALAAAHDPADRLSREQKWLLVLAPLTTMARFEGLFLSALVCALFLLRRRIVYAFALGAAALAPIVVFGVVSMAKGWFFLPNSVVMKASRPPQISLGGLLYFFLGYNVRGPTGIRQISATLNVQSIVIGAVVAFLLLAWKKRSFWEEPVLAMFVFLAMTLLHMQFAQAGNNRYEAYLLAIGVLFVPIALREHLPSVAALRPRRGGAAVYAVSVFAALLWISPLVEKGVVSLKNTPVEAGNIYQQQYQMGLFVKEFFPDAGVIANDIGLVNYFGEGRSLDLFGLANMKIAKLKKAQRFTTQKIAEVAQETDMDIAVVYDTWFAPYGGLPSTWIRVAQWTIKDNLACGGDTVSFYAVRPEMKERLVASLDSFTKELPPEVTWKMFF